eukprot:gene10042-4729_t
MVTMGGADPAICQQQNLAVQSIDVRVLDDECGDVGTHKKPAVSASAWLTSSTHSSSNTRTENDDPVGTLCWHTAGSSPFTVTMAANATGAQA